MIETRRTSGARFGRTTRRSGANPRPPTGPGPGVLRRRARNPDHPGGNGAGRVAGRDRLRGGLGLDLAGAGVPAARGRDPRHTSGPANAVAGAGHDDGNLRPRPLGARLQPRRRPGGPDWVLQEGVQRASRTVGRCSPEHRDSRGRAVGAPRAPYDVSIASFSYRLRAPPDAGSDPVVSTAESDDAGPGNLRLDPAANAIPRPRKSRARVSQDGQIGRRTGTRLRSRHLGPHRPRPLRRSDAIHQGQPPVEATAPAEVPPPVESPDTPEATPPVESQDPIEVLPPVEAPASAEEPPPAEPPPPAEVQDVATPGDPERIRPSPRQPSRRRSSRSVRPRTFLKPTPWRPRNPRRSRGSRRRSCPSRRVSRRPRARPRRTSPRPTGPR